MRERTIELQLERETKGAVRYQELDAANLPVETENAIIGTLYVRKSALDGRVPDRVQVVVRWP